MRRSLARNKKSARAKSPRSHRNEPAFPAQWFYGLLRALPGDQACLTPSPALLSADLTPASGRQNDTTWPYASASFVWLAFAHLTLPRPPHPLPNVRDDSRNAPSVGRDNEGYRTDLGQPASENSEFQKIFLARASSLRL